MPAVVMAIAVVSFFAGSPLYRHQKPGGSPLTRIAQVLVASFRKYREKVPSDKAKLYEVTDKESLLENTRHCLLSPAIGLVEMNTLKAVETHFHIKYPSSFPHPIRFTRRKKPTLCFSNSDESGSDSSSSSEGDKNKQELLARIAMLQTQKVRLTDFLDERSEYLTKFAEDANAEFDEIGEKAMKELDEAGDRIMEKLEGRMQAFEETTDINREEIEKNEKVLEEFKDQIERDRNEGLFFKNLGDKPTQVKAKTEAKVEAQKLREIAKENAGSKVRRNIYLGLISLLAITIADAIFATTEVEWGKVAALVFIFIGLLAQFIYEQNLSNDKQGKRKE